jgi:ribosome biogenesis protein Tsr3
MQKICSTYNEVKKFISLNEVRLELWKNKTVTIKTLENSYLVKIE